MTIQKISEKSFINDVQEFVRLRIEACAICRQSKVQLKKRPKAPARFQLEDMPQDRWQADLVELDERLVSPANELPRLKNEEDEERLVHSSTIIRKEQKK